jgi:DNA replication protein DnaC
MSTGVELDALLRRLHLANARRAWKALCARAEKENWTYQHFLEVLVTEETAQRRATRITRDVRRAGFPFLKTVDDFDFTFQSTLRMSMLGTYLSLTSLPTGATSCCMGSPDVERRTWRSPSRTARFRTASPRASSRPRR